MFSVTIISGRTAIVHRFYWSMETSKWHNRRPPVARHAVLHMERFLARTPVSPFFFAQIFVASNANFSLQVVVALSPLCTHSPCKLFVIMPKRVWSHPSTRLANVISQGAGKAEQRDTPVPGLLGPRTLSLFAPHTPWQDAS